MSALSYVNSRRDLKDALHERMVNSYGSVAEEKQLEEGQNYLKTYLIESNRDIYAPGSKEIGDTKFIVEDTRDHGFLKLKTHGEQNTAYLFVDRLSDRFWAIHSLEKSTTTDSLVDSLIFPRFTDLDHPWLSNQFLENFINLPKNNFRSFSLKYEDEFHEIVGNQSGVKGLSMRLWGDTANQVLSTLRADENISGSTTLSNVGVERDFGGRTLISDITYQSKFTARGESVEGHFKQVREVMDRYQKLLDTIEQDYSISYESRGGGLHISGRPIVLDFGREITNLDGFVDELFSSKKPFRLWGIKSKKEEDYYTIAGVDMHTGDKINFEISPHWMRIYLPEESCGNVVLRLYTNIQHYFDSKAELKGGDNDRII
ncbi:MULTISPECIES: hypothetical protein [unclassified Haloferax]|uniref:hypothetical protein n=1 Tax=unclassified Haloferax TaxID=2625095 RepID=UPI001266F956|nr:MULTISPECIES: hypothetical protein [unclassified Haloferax]